MHLPLLVRVQAVASKDAAHQEEVAALKALHQGGLEEAQEVNLRKVLLQQQTFQQKLGALHDLQVCHP